MRSSEDKCAFKVPKFNLLKNDEFYLWCLRMKDASRGKKVPSAMLKDAVTADITDDALSLVIRALRDNPLRAVQRSTTTKDAWGKLRMMYARKIIFNRLGVLSNLSIIRLKRGKQLGEKMLK